VALVLGFASSPANAKPAAYYGVSCDPGGTHVCQYNGTTDRWVCDLTTIANPNLVSGGATAWMINGLHDSCDGMSTACSNICDGEDYCAFGEIPLTAGGTAKFFCTLGGYDADDMREGVLLGTSANDQLSLWFQEGEEEVVECWMRNKDTSDRVEGLLEGNEGVDHLYGSWEDDPDHYRDILRGGDDADTIMAYAGNDHIFAGAGKDIVNAGAGDDLTYGESGDDFLNGDEHTDDTRGGSGDDLVCGGPGDDDASFGDTGDDKVKDVSGVNDFGNGGPDDDVCEVDVANGSCEDATSPIYDTCPAEVRLYP